MIILSEKRNVVNYDSDKGWSTVFDKFKELSSYSKDTQVFVEYIEKLGNIGDRNVENIAKAIGDVDKSAIQSAKDLQSGKITLDQFKVSAQNAAASSSAFAATLKTVAANMAIMIGINLAIKGLAWAYDQVVHRQENLNNAAIESANAFKETESQLKSTNSELKTTEGRIRELEAKPSLSFVEQEELEKLRQQNEELERTKILLEAQQQISERKSRSDALKALENQSGYESYNGFDVNSDDISYETQKMYLTSGFHGNQIEIANKQLEDYQRYADQKKQIDDKIIELQKNDPIGYAYTLEYQNLNNASSQLKNWMETLETDITSAYGTINSLKLSLDSTADKTWFDSINDFETNFANVFTQSAKDTTDKFNAIWDSSGFYSARKELEKLSKAGELTPETLRSVEGYNLLLEETGETADEVAQHINSLYQDMSEPTATPLSSFSKEEMISTINSMSDGFESLKKIMESQKGENPFNFTLLDDNKFKETFSGFEKEYTAFIDAITKSPKDVNACQSAYDELTTAWINSKGILNGLSEENADVTAQYLKLMNVENAEQLVTEGLAQKHEMLAAQRYYNANASESLREGTLSEYYALLDEADGAGISKMALAQLELGKIAVNNVKIDTSSDIDQIINLANAAGASATALSKLARAKAIYAKAESTGLSGSAGDLRLFEEANGIMDNISTGNFDWDFEIDSSKFKSVTYDSGPGSGSGSGGGSGSEKPKEFDWIQRKIEILRDSYSKYNEELNDSNNSYRTQLNYLSEAERYLQEIIATEKKAEGIYFANWEQASAGLSDDIKSKIMNGNLSVEEYSSNSDAIDKAQAAWDSYANQMKARMQDEKELQNIQDSGHEKRVSHLQEQIETAKALGDASYISYGDSDASLATDLEEIKSQISEAKEEVKDYKDSWKEAKSEIKDAAKEAGVDYNELISGIEDGTLDPLDYDWDQNLRSALVEGAEEYKQFSDLNERITELKTELTTEQKNLANAMDGTSLGYYETVIGLHQQIVDEVKTEVDTARTGWEQAKQALIEYSEANEDVNASSIIADVMNSRADLTQFKDNDALKEIVEGVIEAFGRYENSQKELVDAEMDLEEARREAYEKAIEYVEAQQNAISQINSTIQSEMDLINASGGLIIEASYEEMIQNNDRLIESYEEQIKLIKDRLGEVEEESAEYYELKGDLEECTQEINNAKAEQAEWNRELRLLPVERIDQFLQMLELIKTDLQDFMDWETTLGQANSADEYQQLIDLESERIEKLKEQLATHQELLSEYEYGSDLYKETLTDINDVADAIAKAATEQQEYNKLLLQLPVEKITSLNEELQHYQGIVQAQLDEQETALAAVTGLLQQEADALSKKQDEITEKYQEQIDPIEEQLDALEKQNDALKVQKDLEQSLYDLERANNQKINKVIRDGEIQYDPNQDAIRDANEAVADAQYEKAKYELEQSKIKLEELRDQEIENLDAEIERLDKIKSKWEEICDLISQSINEQSATAFFGDGWQDKVLSGNDQQMYEEFYKLHSSTEFQNDALTKQIESNERIIAQTQIIIDRFNSQEITLEQANSAINQIIGLMSNGFSADEQLSSQLAMDQVNSIKEFSVQTNAQIAENMTILRDSFAIANENNFAIIEIMGTQTEKLEEIRKLDEENKRLYEEMLKKIEERNKRYKHHSSDDGGGDGGWEPSSSADSSGLTYEAGSGYHETESGDHVSNADAGSYDPGGDSHDDDYDDDEDVFHTGAKKGAVGKGTRSRVEFIKQIATTDMKPDERYIRAQVGEMVLTEPQQDQVYKNFIAAKQMTPLLESLRTPLAKTTPVPKTQNIDIHFGDLHLPNVKDTNDFAKAMKTQLGPLLRQELSKR